MTTPFNTPAAAGKPEPRPRRIDLRRPDGGKLPRLAACDTANDVNLNGKSPQLTKS